MTSLQPDTLIGLGMIAFGLLGMIALWIAEAKEAQPRCKPVDPYGYTRKVGPTVWDSIHSGRN